MSKIPEDVAEQARQTWNKIMNNSYRDGSIVISQGILAENERCAKIVETSENGFQTAGDERRAQDIADRIRRR